MQKKYNVDMSKEVGLDQLEELTANKMFRIKSIDFDKKLEILLTEI